MSANTMLYVARNRPISRKLNVKRELELFRQNPLFHLINQIQPDRSEKKTLSLNLNIIGAYGPVDRFNHAYKLCYLCLERLLPEMSALIRGDYFYPYAKGVRFNESRRRSAKKYHAAERFIEFDLVNCLVHLRILADRTIGLSRYFILEPILPSFTSFNEHRKFFRKLQQPFGIHEEYADYIRKKTTWFDLLKVVRDDFLVHQGPKYTAIIGYAQSDNDIVISFIARHQDELMTPLQVSVRRLFLDITQFLKWFDGYGCICLRSV